MRAMRRNEKEVTDRNEILEVLKRNDVIALGLHDGDYPYVIAYNYGFEDTEDGLYLYFHGANEGKTPDLLRQDPKVGFMIYHEYDIDLGKTVCGTTTHFESICGNGEVEFLHDAEGLERALRVLIRHCGDMRMDDFHVERFKNMAVYRLKVKELACKAATVKSSAMYQAWANRTLGIGSPAVTE